MQQSDDSTAPAAPAAPAAPTGRSAPGAPGGRRKKTKLEYEIGRSKTPAYPYDWRDLDGNAVRKIEGTLRTNEWERAVLEYAAGRVRKSYSKFIREAALEAAIEVIHAKERKDDAETR